MMKTFHSTIVMLLIITIMINIGVQMSTIPEDTVVNNDVESNVDIMNVDTTVLPVEIIQQTTTTTTTTANPLSRLSQRRKKPKVKNIDADPVCG